MNKLLILLIIPLLMGCDDTPKVYKVEFKSGKIYRVKSTGYYRDIEWVTFYGKEGFFPRDSVKAITVETYE